MLILRKQFQVQSINTIELFNLLRIKIGEKEAQALTEYIGAHVEDKIDARKDVMATKDDIYQVKEELQGVRVEIKDQKAELLKWMIVLFTPFYIGMIVFLIKQFL